MVQVGGPFDLLLGARDQDIFEDVLHPAQLKRKLMSLSHGQEWGQLAELASDWLFTLVQPIRSQLAY